MENSDANHQREFTRRARRWCRTARHGRDGLRYGLVWFEVRFRVGTYVIDFFLSNAGTQHPGGGGLTMRNLIVLLFALSAAACTTAWPDEGAGGVAELRAPAPPGQKLPPKVAVAARHLECSAQRFEKVAQAVDASGHGTGRVALLGQELNRARRELAGSLPDDAEHTLSSFDQEVAVLGLVVHAEPPGPGHCTA